MKVMLFITIVLALLWSAFVWFANAMRPAETGDFDGMSTIVVAWVFVAILGIAAYWG